MSSKLLSAKISSGLKNCYRSTKPTTTRSKTTTESKKNSVIKKPVQTTPTVSSLKWRTPKDQKPGEFYSKFKVFAPERNDNARVIKFLQTPIDLRPKAIKNWYKNKKREIEENDQKFRPERNDILGNELAAAHFIVHRGGAVKFYLDDKWISRNEEGHYDLPKQFAPSYVIESLDCSGMTLHYDGIENIKGLKKIKNLCIKGCRNLDDWCFDRITGLFCDSLEELDIRGCSNISSRGLQALYRMHRLKLLRLDKTTSSKTQEMIALMLEEQFPKLLVKYE